MLPSVLAVRKHAVALDFCAATIMVAKRNKINGSHSPEGHLHMWLVIRSLRGYPSLRRRVQRCTRSSRGSCGGCGNT
jgi:hypothetical protein